ncbi:MAG TPA: hypothetical protein ACFCUC_16235 [Desulfobacterales bacterium]|jgi:hypothetical protein
MNGEFGFHWSMLLYLLAALGYFELTRRLDRYWANRTPLSDEELLWNYARQNGISELVVFQRAAEEWSVAPGQVDEDFKFYLRNEELPAYVRSYLRKVRALFNADR